MAKTQIPVHVCKDKETGHQKIITAKKRVEELGANAFILTAAAVKKLNAPPPAPEFPFAKAAELIASRIVRRPATAPPAAGLIETLLRQVAAE
jgi:hypothetical protein